jgi:TetR/AcrR family tetracycline transcriptional repressor
MPLTRDEVLAAALRLLEETGLEGLTMRALADALEVQAGAIYWHFANKQALVDAMADQLMVGVLDRPLRGRWDAQLAELCRRLSVALGSRRDSARLATSALQPGPNALGTSEAMLRIVREAGFPREAALWATSALGYYVLGYVTDMQATESAKARGLAAAVLADFEKHLDRDRYPELARFTARGLQRYMTGASFRKRFEFGLEVILEGLRAYRRRRARRR